MGKYNLIKREDIKEDIVKIKGSDTDYVSNIGNIYKDYGNGFFIKKKTFVNKRNGYIYCGITYGNVNKSKRVHRLVAEAFIPNPNNYKIVMHIDDNKSNPNANNLKWGTISENTKDAYDKGFAKNKKGYEDSQSIPICVFDLHKNFVVDYGSERIASKELGVTVTTISNQCKHNVKTIPRCGYYFRYKKEYDLFGFIS